MENKLHSFQFLLNALLSEKLRNECKNPSFLHKAMCIESDHDSTKMRCCLSTFIALYFRRLWKKSLFCKQTFN